MTILQIKRLLQLRLPAKGNPFHLRLIGWYLSRGVVAFALLYGLALLMSSVGWLLGGLAPASPFGGGL